MISSWRGDCEDLSQPLAVRPAKSASNLSQPEGKRMSSEKPPDFVFRNNCEIALSVLRVVSDSDLCNRVGKVVSLGIRRSDRRSQVG